MATPLSPPLYPNGVHLDDHEAIVVSVNELIEEAAEEVAAREFGDAALDVRLDAVEAAQGDFVGQEALDTSLASLSAQIEALEGADEALGGDLGELAADFVAMSDSLDEEMGARAAADTALDGRLDVVEAALPLKAATSALTTEAETRTSADAALDARLDTIELELPNKVEEGDVTAAVNAAINGLLGGAPGALDTLNEIAAAIGDDADFAATIMAALGAKAGTSGELIVPGAFRTALGLGTAATKDSGTSAGQLILGNDARLTDARTPTAHAASHASGGTDALTLAQSQITGLTAALTAKADDAATTTALTGKQSLTGHTAESLPMSVAGTLADVAVPASSFVGRKATGDVGVMTVVEANALLRGPLGKVSANDATLQAPAATTSWVAVDSTRLPSITFTVPASGTVTIVYEAFAIVTRTSATTTLQWCVLDGGSEVAGSGLMPVSASGASGASVRCRVRATAVVTGLTPGASKTWTWAHKLNAAVGSGSTAWGDSAPNALGLARMMILEGDNIP